MDVQRLLRRLSWLTTVLGFLLLGSRSHGVVNSAKSGSGKIQFLNRMVNFGDVTRGEQLHYRFHFQNIGHGPLRIQGVHAACGCTIAEVAEQKSLEPGEGSFIDLTFKTDSFVGPITKAITVMTNERLSPNQTLTIRANVLAEFMADPPVVDFGDVEDAATAKRLVKIRPVGNYPLDIKGLNFNQESLDVSWQKAEGNVWQVEVGLKPFRTSGFLKESVMVASNSQSLPQFRIVVRANLQGPIRFEPPYLEFGAIAKAGQAKRLIRLQGSRAFQVTKSWLELNLNGKAISNGQDYFTILPQEKSEQEKDVEITLRNLASLPGSIHGKLFLETSDQLQGRIVLDFYGFFL